MKLEKKRKAKVLRAIRAGNTISTAAAVAGVHRSTVYEWQKSVPGFADAIETARAQAEARDVATIARAARRGTWKAAAFMLERRSPRTWGPRLRLELTKAIDGFLEHLERELDLETFEKVRLAALAYDQDPDLGEAERLAAAAHFVAAPGPTDLRN